MSDVSARALRVFRGQGCSLSARGGPRGSWPRRGWAVGVPCRIRPGRHGVGRGQAVRGRPELRHERAVAGAGVLQVRADRGSGGRERPGDAALAGLRLRYLRERRRRQGRHDGHERQVRGRAADPRGPGRQGGGRPLPRVPRRPRRGPGLLPRGPRPRAVQRRRGPRLRGQPVRVPERGLRRLEGLLRQPEPGRRLWGPELGRLLQRRLRQLRCPRVKSCSRRPARGS